MRPTDPTRTRRHERGGAMVAVVVIALICGAIAASVLLPMLARQREAEAHVQRQRAFHAAEAGIDWAIAQLRRTDGVIPTNDVTRTNLTDAGDFALTFTRGTSNNTDDDGDGITDEPDEVQFVTLTSVGASGNEERAIEVVMRRSVEMPTIDAAITMNVETPILDVNGNSFIVDGREHLIDGTLDASGPEFPALSTPAPTADIASQIPGGRRDQFIGAGGRPSLRQSPAMDLDTLFEQAAAAATLQLSPGTHANSTLGTATTTGVETVFVDGDLHLSGNSAGAGVLVVDGDLIISGSFTWTGVILVRGKSRMVGGGGAKRMIGAMIIGEEVEATTSSSPHGHTRFAGTVDLLYSTAAIQLSQARLGIMRVLSWQEVPVP